MGPVPIANKSRAEMAPKEKLTLYQIAELAGTSKSTVSRVLNGGQKVSPKVYERVKAIIRQHNFVPSIAARSLSHGRKNMIAVISGGISDGYFAGVIRGIDIEAEDRNNHLLCSFGRNEAAFTKLWDGVLNQQLVDGIILIAPPDSLSRTRLDSKLPVVICSSRPAPTNGWEKASSITVDNADGFKQILDRMYNKGLRHYVHIAGPSNDFDAGERRKAFDNFLKNNPECHGSCINAGKSRTESHKAVSEFLNNNSVPDAFVCYNDSTASGAIAALELSGYTDAVTVSGCDGEAASELLKIPTLNMPFEEIGRQAADILFSMIDNPDSGPVHKIIPLTLTTTEIL